jgi:hypothetical protein
MIFVQRETKPKIFEGKAATKEKTEAEDWYTRNPPEPTSYKFKFYSTYKNKYKDLLIGMFHSRCAYCECAGTVGQRGDIEHFRPKSVIVTRAGEIINPGYYWLAMDWSNLYLSCISCNQETTFNIIDPNDPALTIRKTAGKMEQFDVADAAYRRNRHTMTLAEEEPYRLLIDPCKDNPEDYFEYLDNGVIRSRTNNGLDADKARYTIDVFVLLREQLVTFRKAKYVEVMDKITRVKRATPLVTAGIQNQDNSANFTFVKEDLESSFVQLIKMTDEREVTNEYIALVRQYARPCIEEHAARIAEMLDDTNRAQPWFTDARDYFAPQMAALKNYYDRIS